MSSGIGGTALSESEEHELVTALAELALEQAAPEELALFPETADEYFRDPEATLRADRRDEAVGFGLELAMLTPYVLAVGTAVVKMLASLVQRSVEDELQPSVAHLVRRLLRGGDKSQPASPLSTDQLRRVRAAAYDRAVQLGLDQPRASLLADSLVGGLVTG